MIAATPLPEEFAHVGNVRTSSNGIQRLVIDGKHGGAHEGLAIDVGEFHLHFGGTPGLVFRSIGEHFHVQHSLGGRHDDLALDRMHFAVRYGEGLDEEIRHVTQFDLDCFIGDLAFQGKNLRAHCAIFGVTHEEVNSAVRTFGGNHQFHFIARRILGFVHHEFELIESEIPSVLTRTTHHKNITTFLFPPLLVLDLDRQPILPRDRRAEFGAASAFLISLEFLLGNFRFSHDPFFVVGKFQQSQRACASDPLLIQGACGNTHIHRVPHVIVTAIRPCINLERLPGDEHLAVAHDGAAAFIRDFHGDVILVVFIRVQFLCQGRIQIDLQQAVRADHALLFQHQFRGIRRPRHPPPARRLAAPLIPARHPVTVITEPPIPRTIIPIPRPHRIPLRGISAATHRRLHLRILHGCPKIIFRRDLGRKFLPQRHRIPGRIHNNFKLGLLVFFHTKLRSTMSIVMIDGNTINPQPRILRQRQFIIKSTFRIRLKLLLKNLFVLRIPDRYAEGFTAEKMFVFRLIKGCHPGPRLKLHLLGRPVDGAVGEGENFRPLRHLIFLPIPDGIVSQMGKPPLRSGRGDHPLVSVGHGFFIPEKLPLRIGEFRKILRLNMRLPAAILFLGIDVLLLISEDIQSGLAHRFPRQGIHHEILHFRAVHLPDDDGIRHPQQHPRKIAIRHLCLQKISPARLQRRGNLHALVQMSLARLEFQIPLRHFLADVFLLPLLKDLVTDILRLGALPVQRLGIAL